MQDAPVGRGGDEPDGARDRHDGLAQPCASWLKGESLRAREHRLSFCGKATVATSPHRGQGGATGVSYISQLATLNENLVGV